MQRAVDRGSVPDDVARRMAAQPGRAERRRWADHVVENTSTIDELQQQVDELWDQYVPQSDVSRAGGRR